MEKDSKFFEVYGPLKNKLRGWNLSDLFELFWRYVLFLQFETMPPNGTIPPEVLRDKAIRRFFSEWEIEILLREAIICSQLNERGRIGILKWKNFQGMMNKLKEVDGFIAKEYINSSNVLEELFRIGFRQFPWQEGQQLRTIKRYFKIWSDADLDSMVQDELKMPYKKVLIISLFLFGFYLKSPRSKVGYNDKLKGISEEEFYGCLENFSKDIEELSQLLEKERLFNDKFNYSFCSLRAYPLIKVREQDEEYVYCPMPPLLANAATIGIYYRLVDKNEHFGDKFGRSFESYIGEVAKVVNDSGGWSIYDDNGDRNGNTVDWIIEENEISLFVECKTKRVPLSAKISLFSDIEMNETINILVKDGIVKSYKAIQRYLEGDYPNVPFKNDLIYPIIVTLEPWYLFGPRLDHVKNLVREELRNEGLSESLVDKYPFLILSASEFEDMIQVMKRVGMAKFKEVVFDNMGEDSIKNLMGVHFENETKNLGDLFESELDEFINSYK